MKSNYQGMIAAGTFALLSCAVLATASDEPQSGIKFNNTNKHNPEVYVGGNPSWILGKKELAETDEVPNVLYKDYLNGQFGQLVAKFAPKTARTLASAGRASAPIAAQQTGVESVGIEHIKDPVHSHYAGKNTGTDAAGVDYWRLTGEFKSSIQKRKRGTGQVVQECWAQALPFSIVFAEDKSFCAVQAGDSKVGCTVNHMADSGHVDWTTGRINALPASFSPGNLSITIAGDDMEQLYKLDQNKGTGDGRCDRWEAHEMHRAGGHIPSVTIDHSTLLQDTGVKWERTWGRPHFLMGHFNMNAQLWALDGEAPLRIAGGFNLKYQPKSGTVLNVRAGNLVVDWMRDATYCKMTFDDNLQYGCTVETLPTDNFTPFDGSPQKRKLKVKLDTATTLKLLTDINNRGSLDVRGFVTAFIGGLTATNRGKNVTYELRVNDSTTEMSFLDNSSDTFVDQKLILDLSF